ncbi:Ig-like protein group 1 [Sphaerotilus hippei]|uniref:Ig-like protein group 1 n=1 Tax=Sphaerotilus hippei TaxID=744406 RepID=A0A318H4Z9_9BURK|nr:Ig-like domain-containing protein [Sphaerotilus hippei]PXW97126.1 Ig-like protein group 1 [Sphaerotilus hippei]
MIAVNMVARVLCAVAAATLVACGGGGGASGSSVFDGTGSTGTSTTTSETVSSSTAGTVVLSLSSSTVSASTPGTVSALVKKSDGTPMSGVIVRFAVTAGKATVSPDSVLTDTNGVAAASITPVSGTLGADYVTAAAELSSTSTLSTRAAFTVSAVDVALANMTASPAPIDAYGASAIGVDVTGASATSPVTVNFSSTCASSGKAVLSPTTVTVTGTTASITYQDKGCAGTDRISASIVGTSQQRQVDLVVAAPVALALEYVSSSPEKICLAGSGCDESAVVKFRLRDQYANPVAGSTVNFSLDIAGVATLYPLSQQTQTDTSGIAQVSVKSGSIPTPVRVRAEYTTPAGTKLSTVSNVLAINAGLPTQRAVSFSAATYNVDGWSVDGTESAIRVQLNDRFGNPVPDGTSVSFVAEGASVIPARCTTVSGVCSVKFVTSNYRPPNGRVTVVAFAQGEESFVDSSGDNLYTAGESFDDLGEVFVDKDENSSLDTATGEYLAGSAKNGVWDGNSYVRVSRVFTLSNSAAEPRLFAFDSVLGCDAKSTAALTTLSALSLRPSLASCRVSQLICIRDANIAADALGGNPIPAGATLTATTKAKGAAVSVDFTPIPSTVTGATAHRVTAELSDCSKALEASGPLDLEIKMPAGQTYTFDIGMVQ